MATISDNVQDTKNRIRQAVRACGRHDGEVRLLAVSKTCPAEAIREAWRAGQRAFGENYVQEAVTKITALNDLDLEWHFIGPLQSNKTREVAEHFSWVHSIDRLRIAERLSAQRPADLPDLQICLQINVSGEDTKSGIPPGEAATLAQAVMKLPRLNLRGLMCIPEPVHNDDHGPDVLRARFQQLRELRDQLNAGGCRLDVLSMGMSDDFELAIREGSTLVRMGTAIFGSRTPR